jgi:broad specificity phosphatase PhoE
MTRVVLIRPGATLYDDQNRLQGVLDIPLSDRGKAEAAALADRLQGVDLAALYASPGESSTRTAEAVGRVAGLRPKRLDDLLNLDLGLWQGLQRDEIRRRHGKVFRQWLDDPRTICPPQGEPIDDALERVRDTLKPILRRHRDETIALVVPDPLALLVAGFLLRSNCYEQLDDPHTGSLETLDVAPDVLKNGDGG